MSVPVLILGESGSGKSYSLRNMDPSQVLLIQAIPKKLPFRTPTWKRWDAESKTGNILHSDDPVEMTRMMMRTHRKIIVLDDYQYSMSFEYMRRSGETGYNKFTEIGYKTWSLFCAAAGLADDVRIYIMSHVETTDAGRIQLKTIGKLLNDKITPEGMFTICLRAQGRDTDRYFSTQTNGSDPVKSPMGMFPDPTVPNDLALVDAAICEYYGIK